MNNFIVSFFPGSSGRFISNVIWRMITEMDSYIPLDENNSAHPVSSWGNSCHHPYGILHDSSIYKNVKFDDIGLLATHSYPDFDAIRVSLPQVKVVIIGITEDVIPEVAANSITKNRNTTRNANEKTVHLKWLFNMYKKGNTRGSFFTNFCDPDLIPEDLRDRISILYYRDIYTKVNDSYVALEHLKKITGKDALPNVMRSYEAYVQARNCNFG